jgi:hypothetical protein
LAAMYTDFGEPLCPSSRAYQRQRLAQIDGLDLPEVEKEALRATTLARSCICDHLGNSALIALGLAEEADAPQAVCPGPNLAWFDRTYSLQEMMDHIYGRGASLVPAERPHMFAAELALNLDDYAAQAAACKGGAKELAALREYRGNLEAAMSDCLALSRLEPYPGENLASLSQAVAAARQRLDEIAADLAVKAEAAAAPVSRA